MQMAWRQTLTVIFTLISVVQIGLTQTGMDLKNLYDELLNKRNYQKVVPPFESLKQPINVRVTVDLYGINSLNEVQGKLATTAHLTLEWHDAFLTWNKKDFNNISYIYMPQNEVWKPDVSLNNGFNKLRELGDEVIQVTIMHTGNIVWRPFEVFETNCDIDITKFPFDTQVCKLVFRLWASQPLDVKFELSEPALKMDTYKESSVWDLDSAEVMLQNGNVVVLLTLDRRPQYYILSLLCPIILLSLLDIFTFVIPANSGEKLGYSMTAYVAFAVFFTIINSSLPINSRTTSYMAVFVISLLIKGTTIVMVTAIQVRVHQRTSKTDLPQYLRRVIEISRWMRSCSSTRVKPNTDNTKKEKLKVDVQDSQHLTIAQKHSEPSKLPLDGRSDVKEDENDIYTWANACDALDGFFFCFFFVVAVILSIVFFAALP
ncbi:acetylcholine receptor subunit beta-type unc-29-like [Ylistrum balloti]|uniref:acetylcholine receptor subunit beta-type unc-29-like n=1 Tax=Ylistrum balloti TaxID=509963 RepID=UPI002905EB80|nr:acetylcholine receptor subunit beta-type unc-29-like [Ylistrum balloti]